MYTWCINYCKPTVIRDDLISRFTCNDLVRNDLSSRSSLMYTSFFITTIWQTLVHGKTYSRQWGYRKPHKKLSHAYKSWFTVYNYLTLTYMYWSSLYLFYLKLTQFITFCIQLCVLFTATILLKQAYLFLENPTSTREPRVVRYKQPSNPVDKNFLKALPNCALHHCTGDTANLWWVWHFVL